MTIAEQIRLLVFTIIGLAQGSYSCGLNSG